MSVLNVTCVFLFISSKNIAGIPALPPRNDKWHPQKVSLYGTSPAQTHSPVWAGPRREIYKTEHLDLLPLVTKQARRQYVTKAPSTSLVLFVADLRVHSAGVTVCLSRA